MNSNSDISAQKLRTLLIVIKHFSRILAYSIRLNTHRGNHALSGSRQYLLASSALIIMSITSTGAEHDSYAKN
jgi:hypothetical protein